MLAVGFSGVVGGDLVSESLDASGDLLLGEEDFHGRGGRKRRCLSGLAGEHRKSGYRGSGCGERRSILGIGAFGRKDEGYVSVYQYWAAASRDVRVAALAGCCCGGIVLHRNFLRNGVDADALSVVTVVTVAGVLGAKTWHELQDVPALVAAMKQIALPGWSHPMEVLVGFSPVLSVGSCVVWGVAGGNCDVDVGGSESSS